MMKNTCLNKGINQLNTQEKNAETMAKTAPETYMHYDDELKVNIYNPLVHQSYRFVIYPENTLLEIVAVAKEPVQLYSCNVIPEINGKIYYDLSTKIEEIGIESGDTITVYPKPDCCP